MRIASGLRELARGLDLNPSETSLEKITDALKNHPDRQDIIRQMSSQEKGIPYEYQFGYICWWLGKCVHMQFIDPQPEFPYLNKIENIKYPDVFAVFSLKKSTFPSLIQVKSCNEKILTMSKNYVNGLKKHPLSQEYPILIAWKYREFWTLFDIDTFKTSKGNVKVKFEDAMKANLMSSLIGDRSFCGFKQGIEWHYIIEPQDAQIDAIRTGKINKFIGKFVDISVKDLHSGNYMKISGPLFYLLSFLGEWEPFNTRYTKSQIIEGDRNQSQVSLFAYQTLIFGAMFQANITGRKVDWRELLKNRKFVFTFGDIHDLIRDGRDKEMGFEYSPLRYLPSTKNPCMEDFYEEM